MKRYLSVLLIFAVTITLFSACEKPLNPAEEEHKYGKIIYVSPNGNDENNGEKSSPVASLSGAVKALRAYRAENGLPEGGIKIEFAEGTYYVTEGITLTAEDSGTEASPIVFAGADGADVLLSGGVTLDPTDFKPADDAFKSLLQTEEAKQNVIMIDLAKAGCYDLADISYGSPEVFRQELYINGERQDVARWPNGKGSYHHPEKVDGDNIITDENGNLFGKIYITEKQAALWSKAKSCRLLGYPEADFFAYLHESLEIDETDSSILLPIYPSGGYGCGLGEKCLYFVYNIPQELDAPGEYYWDTETNILYYWPAENFDSSEVVFSQLSDTFINLDKCSFINFENLSVKYARRGFLDGTGDFITISKCSISNVVGRYAIRLAGDNNTVTGCLLCNLAAGGISFTSGNVATQTFGNSVISDNIIHHWGEEFPTEFQAVDVKGYGLLVSHNTLHDTSNVAIQLFAGETVIEYNEIYNCCKESSDMGAIHTVGQFTYYDNVLRYNYIHNIRDYLNTSMGIKRDGLGNAIYFDCFGRYASCYGNLFVDIAGTAMCGASGYMDLHDNICVNVGEPINIVYWGPEEAPDAYDTGWLASIRLYDYLGRIWRYTAAKTVLFVEVNNQDENYTSYDLPFSPSHFHIRNNVRYIDESSDFPSYDESQEDPYMFHTVRGVQWAFDLCAISDNVCYRDDPGFTDYANGDYTLRKDSRVFRDLIGFEEPDLSTVGARASENPFK